jgi:ligand-binding sensor domain-containing protein
MGIRSVIITFLFSFLSYHLVCQESDFIFSQFTVQNGLPSNECHDIIQDKEGYIWVATDSGVARFDGSKFKTYGHKDGLKDLVMFSLREDKAGRIFAGGQSGDIYVYDVLIDKFELYSQNEKLNKNPNSALNYAKDFEIVDNNRLLIPKWNLGLLSIRDNGDTNVDSINIDIDYEIHSGSNNALIVVGSYDENENSEFYTIKWNFKEEQFTESNIYNIPHYSDGIFNRISICKNDNGAIGNVGGVLFKLEKNGQHWSRSETDINRIQKNSLGEPVLLFDRNKGVRIYQSLKSNRYYTLFTKISASGFLEDKNGGYWVTSLDKGLLYINNTNIKYVTPLHKSKLYTHVTSNGKGSLYTAAFEGLLEKIDLESRYIDLLKYDAGEDFQMVKYDKYRDLIWYSNGVTVENIESDKSINVISNLIDNQYMSSMGASNIYFTNENVYMVRNGYNIAEIDRAQEEVAIDIFDKKGSAIRERIWHVHVTVDSQLLFSKEDGLFHLSEDQFISYRSQDTLSKYRMNGILEDNSGNLYFASQGAGLIIDNDNYPLRAITEKDGILSNNLEDITFGDENIIWLASLKGISRVEMVGLDSFQIQNFTTHHGLPVPDVYDIEWYNNKLYAATGKGVIEFSESEPITDSETPKLLSIHCNGKQINIDKLHQFSHDENNILVEYATIDYRAGEYQKYRYRINNAEWIETDQRSLYLVNLSPNSYKVEIQSQNPDQYWSLSNVVTFEVKAAWRNSWWFYTLLGILTSGFLTLLFLFREKSMKKEIEVQQKLRTLEKAALQSQMNPHFIFNCLNSIQRFIMDNDKLAAMDYLSRFAKLIRLTLNASTENEISIYDEVKMLKYYLGLEKLRYKNKFTYEVIVDENVDQHNTFLSPLLVQPLVENAIKHGMKDIEEDGIIEVIISKDDLVHKILVKDNGSGFSKDWNNNDFIDEYRSLGMKITSDRLGVNKGISINRSDGWTTVSIQI